MDKQSPAPARQPEILLASASPRRQELLRQIGVGFRLISHDVEEIRLPGETPPDFVRRLAREKAVSGLTRAPADQRPVVLGADTAVVCEGKILGKPVDRDDALAMLRLLSGRRHLVHSAVAVVSGESRSVALSTTEVEFRELTAAELEAYWASGEPVDKAGAYAIQGLAAVFVKNLHGSYSGVMGLPLFETAVLLEQHGIACWQPGADKVGNEQ